MLPVFFLMLRACGCSVLCSRCFLLCGSVWCFNLPFLNVLGFMPTVLFLMWPPRTGTKHQHTFHARTMYGERDWTHLQLCICTCNGDPGTKGIDPMAFTCHDMVLEVPLKRCVVLDMAAKLKRSPAQSTSIFFMFTLTLCIECMECGGALVRWCGGVVVWCCGVGTCMFSIV